MSNKTAKLEVEITAKTTGLQQGMEEGEKSVKKFGNISEEKMKQFEGYLSSAKEACSKAMKTMGTSIAAAITAMIGLAESTEELRANQAKLNTAFGDTTEGAKLATSTYDALYRVLGDDGQATEAAAHLAKLTNNEKDLAEWTKICQGVYGTFGDSLPIEGLTEAANETVKTSKVTGVLADALNWAGESEDDFNSELEKCTKASEREALVRKKLTSLYQNASQTYEKTAKNTLKANEAQNQLNKSLSTAGNTVLPLSNAIKTLGANLLDKAQKPLKEITNYLTNNLIPAVNKAADFVEENSSTIISAIAGIGAAIVTYKAAVLAVQLAEEGWTIATLAAAAAQKVFDAIMASSPWGLAATAIVAVTAALVTYAIATKDAAKDLGVLNEEEQALVDSISDTTKALEEQEKAWKESSGNILAQSNYNKQLADELLELADASGKVKEQDEARAQFILNELNDAYGTEYTLIDGQISQYEELAATIYEAINAETAKMLLEARREAYVEAIENESEALAALGAAEKDYSAQLAISEKATYEAASARQYFDWAVQNGIYTSDLEIVARSRNVNDLERAAQKEADILDEKKRTYDEAANNYGIYYSTINEYEEASAKILEGNATEAIDLLTEKGMAYGDYSEDVSEATKKTIEALYQEAIDAGIEAARTKENFENGVEGYTEEMVEEAGEAYDNALAEWAHAYSDGNAVGTNLGNGLKAGMSGTEYGLIQRARGIVNNIIATMKNTAQIKSPSKKTKILGKYIDEGLEVGMNENTKGVVKSAKNVVSNTLNPFKEALGSYSAKNLNSIFQTSSINRGICRTISTDDNKSLIEGITSALAAGDNRPIILQVDGKTFAQTSIDSINKLTRQTGSLALNLV